jgi:hypothetical protein
MDGYNNQPVRNAFDAVALTDTAADNQYVFDCGGMTALSLDLGYAMGAAETSNKLHFTLEHSSDNGVTWHSLVIDNTSAVSTITPRVWELAGTNSVNVLVTIAYKMLRLSLYESGVATNAGTASVDYTLSGV